METANPIRDGCVEPANVAGGTENRSNSETQRLTAIGIAVGDGFGALETRSERRPRELFDCPLANIWRPARFRKSAQGCDRRGTDKGERVLIALFVMVLAALPLRASAWDCEDRHPLGDAWFTGPMLANTAATAPRGHYMAETYLYDVTSQGSYNRGGARQSAPHANGYGSLTYLIYGVTDRFAAGLVPTAGYNTVSGGLSSVRPGMGDLSILLQRRFTQFNPCNHVPIVSLAVEETLPTGKYDRLGDRPSDGVGQGAFTTMPALYSQMYFWLPNRRIVRTRVDVSESISMTAGVQGVSVYGTDAGFRGTAHPGSSLYIDTSVEYSATRSWVLAVDATYRNTGNTRIIGTAASGSATTTVRLNTGWSDTYSLAPAVEYSWKSTLGVLLGVRLTPAGHNTSNTVTPAIAINFVH